MKSAITVSLVTQAKGGPFVYWNGLADACEKAAALGFDAIEIFPPAANVLDIAEVQGLLDHHKLKVAAVGTGGGWVIHKWTLTHPDETIRKQAREFIRAIIDVAGGFGAPAILGSMQGRWENNVTRKQALAWLGEALDDLGEHAASHGTIFLYEPLNRYETNLFNRQQDAADWLRTLKTQNVRLLCDLFHMAIRKPTPRPRCARAGRSWGMCISPTRIAAPSAWATRTSRPSSPCCATSDTKDTSPPRSCRCRIPTRRRSRPSRASGS